MKIVVISDNHGLETILSQIRLQHSDADGFIHCGDSELLESQLEGWISVEGNNDYYAELPSSRIVNIKGYKIYITHSHRFSYFHRNERMVQQAKLDHCQMVCFGHTHVFYWGELEGVKLCNPGSLRYNRDGSNPCYAVVTIDDDDFSKVSVERIEI